MLRSYAQANLSLTFTLICCLMVFVSCRSSSQSAVNPQSLTDRERDGLIGNVKAALTADVIMVEQNGQWFEGQQASSTAVYDSAGKRTLLTPFRVSLPGGYGITQHELLFDPTQKGRQVEERQPGPETMPAGRWLKTYDSKGNLLERALLNTSGATVKKDVISYEFDATGNWIKRGISRLVEKEGKQVLLPSEASYRHLVYFDSATGTSRDPHASPASAEASQPKIPVAATQENLDSGRAHFLQRCAVCHGEDGKAQTDFATVMPTRPADLTGQQVGALSEAEIYSFVSGGIKSSGMPAFKGRISDEAIWQLALFVKGLSRNQGVDKASQIAKASPSPKPTSSAEPERRYTLVGKVISIERELQQVVIEHEEVRGYMEAMTMPFPLKDEKVLSKLKKGDKIQATLIVGIGFWRLENVVIR